jgi:tetraacyldisaccharide 4'-kinase
MGHGRRPWVIGVGNLEAGGTGKTPVVLDLARRYHAAGIRVALLLRGHGGGLGNPPRSVTPDDLAAASDETRLYRHALAPVVPIMVARHRAAGLELLRRDFDLDVVLVDDAFQTSGLAVDRHLVLLDATAPLGNGWLLPAGRLREPPAALVHAHAILFTRDQTGVVPQHPAWEAQRRTGMLFTASEEVAALRAFDGGPTAWEALRGAGIATLCGIGRPAAFEAAMRDLGARH